MKKIQIAAAPIERVKLLLQCQDEMIKQGTKLQSIFEQNSKTLYCVRWKLTWIKYELKRTWSVCYNIAAIITRENNRRVIINAQIFQFLENSTKIFVQTHQLSNVDTSAYAIDIFCYSFILEEGLKQQILM